MDNTHSAHSVNPESLLALVLECGGGYIPPTGTYSAKVWSRLLGISPDAVRKRMKAHKIPFKEFGDEKFYAARHVRDRLPLIEQEE